MDDAVPAQLATVSSATYNDAEMGLSREVQEVLKVVIDQYRDQCLWFLRPGYYPDTVEEALRVLESIQHHGDREAFRRAGEVRRWLSQSSSATSAGS